MNSKTSFYENLAQKNLTAILEESNDSSSRMDLVLDNQQKPALYNNTNSSREKNSQDLFKKLQETSIPINSVEESFNNLLDHISASSSFLRVFTLLNQINSYLESNPDYSSPVFEDVYRLLDRGFSLFSENYFKSLYGERVLDIGDKVKTILSENPYHYEYCQRRDLLFPVGVHGRVFDMKKDGIVVLFDGLNPGDWDEKSKRSAPNGFSFKQDLPTAMYSVNELNYILPNDLEKGKFIDEIVRLGKNLKNELKN